MTNFLQHKREIISNFCNTFKKIAYKTLWGIDLNCNVKLPEYVWLDRTLLKYQEISDCCSDCTNSYKPQNCVISQFANYISSCTYPFIQLSTKNQQVNCTYINVGDFNQDFNSDFFK